MVWVGLMAGMCKNEQGLAHRLGAWRMGKELEVCTDSSLLYKVNLEASWRRSCMNARSAAASALIRHRSGMCTLYMYHH